MLDNQLIALVIAQINAGFSRLGFSVAVKQSYQPTRQGVNAGPTLYLHKLYDERMGSVGVSEQWIGSSVAAEDDTVVTAENATEIQGDNANGFMQHTETQQYVTYFQATALSVQDPSNINSLTASDIANYAVSILQGTAFVSAIEAQGVGILKVGQIRNPYFDDDRQRFEASPSFDFGLTHKQIIVTTVPVITTTDYQILAV